MSTYDRTFIVLEVSHPKFDGKGSQIVPQITEKVQRKREHT